MTDQGGGEIPDQEQNNVSCSSTAGYEHMNVQFRFLPWHKLMMSSEISP